MPSSSVTSLPNSSVAAEQTWTGHISDSICGSAHHRKTADGSRKLSARECTLASVKDGAEYVFVSLGKIYKIANQDFPALQEHAGHTVDLTGIITDDTIQVSNVVMPVIAGTKISVFGIFYDKKQAADSVEKLTKSEFSTDDVSILAPEVLGSKDIAHDRDARAGNSTAVVTSSVAIGGTIGFVAGMGAASISGAGPLPAAPMLGALAGMGAGGLIGGAIDAIDAVGPPDHAAKRYEGHVEEGGILVTIHCYTDDRVARAKELLAEMGARAISSSDESTAEFQAALESGARR